jgi:anti-sigma28 factor (negative regulator of flagellin synthesis)
MKSVKAKKESQSIQQETETLDLDEMRRKRIEQLKTMINNEEYLAEAVVKLANSLTSGLMK